MRLNLGAGVKRIEGFLNVDLDVDTHPDIVGSISDLSAVESGTVEEIVAYHVIEHIFRWDVHDTLTEWRRVLIPGGKVAIECPDLDKCIHNYLTYPDRPELSTRGIFGDDRLRDPLHMHHWCFTIPELINELRRAGFVKIREEEPQTHRPMSAMRDLRLVAYKPDEMGRASYERLKNEIIYRHQP